MDKIIKVNNLSKNFKEVKAVNNISFTVKKGGMFALLGLNGAGKSTTINMICQILEKDSGKIFINNTDIDTNSNSIKNEIGIVFQNSVLDKELSVIQNLKSRASLYNLDKKTINKKIAELIELFELNNIKNRSFGVLSGGQKRRVDIVRALIHEPSILFLDEPTTGLDPVTRDSVWKILHKLMDKNNLTIVLTTHYMEEVLKSNYVVILDEGSIVAEGSPDNLKELYASDLLRILSKKSKNIENILNKNSIKYTYQKSCYYINLDNTKEAYNILSLNPELFDSFEVIKGNMDQVFLNVTGKDIGDNT